MTALGIYLLSSMVFTVGALLEFAVVIVVDRLNNSKTAHVTRKGNTQYTTSNPFNKPAPIPCIRMRNVAGRKTTSLFEMSEKNLTESPGDKTNSSPFFFSVDKIDAAAFWSYLTIYLVFNIVYWVAYLK